MSLVMLIRGIYMISITEEELNEENLREKFSTRLITERRKIGKTQNEIADFLQMTRPTYGKYENGNSFPQLISIVKMCKLFNVSSDYLLGITDERTPVCDKHSPNEKICIKTLQNS